MSIRRVCERINKDIFGFDIGSFDDEIKSNYVGVNGYYYTNRDGSWRQVNNKELTQIEEYNKADNEVAY